MAKKDSPINVIHNLKLNNPNFNETLKRETDRGAALVGVEYLNNVLEVVLRSVLVDKPAEVDRLFDAFQPLATFSSRLRLAFCLGLIGPKLYEDMSLVNKIRNIFAHSYLGMDFQHPDIEKMCLKLQMPDRIRLTLDPPSVDAFTNRHRYIITIQWIAGLLLQQKYNHKSLAKDFQAVIVRPKTGITFIY